MNTVSKILFLLIFLFAGTAAITAQSGSESTVDTEIESLKADLQAAIDQIDLKSAAIEGRLKKMAKSTRKELKERIEWLEAWDENLTYRRNTLDKPQADEWDAFQKKSRKALNEFKKEWNEVFGETK